MSISLQQKCSQINGGPIERHVIRKNEDAKYKQRHQYRQISHPKYQPKNVINMANFET